MEAASDDIGEPAQWLARQEFDESYTIAFPEFTEQMARKAPERAVAWAMGLRQQEFRELALNRMGEVWSGWNFGQVQAMVDANDVAEEVRSEMIGAHR